MYQKQGKSLWKHLDFIIWDLIILELSFVLAYVIRHGIYNHHRAEEYMAMGGVMALIQLVIVVLNENYKDILRRGYLVELKSVFIQNTMVMLFAFAFMFVTKQQGIYSRIVFFYTWLLGTCFMYAERLLWKRFVRNQMLSNDERAHMLVICNEESMEKNLNRLQSERFSSYKVFGAIVYGKEQKGGMIAGIPVVANWSEAFEFARKEVIDEIFLDIAAEEEEKNVIITNFLQMGITVHVGLGWNREELPNRIVQNVGECSVLTTSIKTASTYQLFVKRLMDIAGSLVGLLVTGILYLILAPIIHKQSPGPTFFSQERVGRNGRKFRIYKFRSMYMDAEERKKELMKQNKMSGHMFKMDDDPRITPIGKIIRKYSLDEFPQFWNVLKGDMSLVGTRPPTVDEFEQYEGHHKVRLSIKPGLTGMWQVSGRSDITDFEEVVRLDNKYIAEWNLRLDIKIIIKTIGVVLGSKGSV